MSDAKLTVIDLDVAAIAPQPVGALPPMDDDDREIHRSLVGIARVRMELDARQLGLLERANAKSLHRKRGHATLVEYMEHELGYRAHTAYEYLRVAAAIEHLPLCKESLWDKSIHYSKVREISRIATADTEYDWLEAARDLSVHELEKLVAGRKHGDRPQDPKREQTQTSPVKFQLTPATRARLRHARVELESECGERLTDDELFDIMVRRSLEPAAHGPDDSDGSGRPAYQMTISTCRECKRSWTEGGAEEHDVDDASLACAQCDSEGLGDVELDTPARVRSSVTPLMRRRVYARDNKRCCVPNCRSGRNLDIHHIKSKESGGRHVISNLTLLCSGHHRLLHLGRLAITGTAPENIVVSWNHDDEPQDEADVSARELLRANLDDKSEHPRYSRPRREPTVWPRCEPTRRPTWDETSSPNTLVQGLTFEVTSRRIKEIRARSHVGPTE